MTASGYLLFRDVCKIGLARQGYTVLEIETFTDLKAKESDSAILHAASICSQINHLSGDPTCSLKLGLSAHPLDYGNIGHLAQQCENLGEALHLVFHYINAFIGGIHYELKPNDNSELLNIEINIDDDLKDVDCTALIEFRTAILMRMSHYLTGDVYGIETLFSEVSFTHSPQVPLDEYIKLLPVSAQFDTNKNRLVLFKNAIFRPIPLSDKYLKQLFLKKVQDSYFKLLQGRPLQEKIKLYIRDFIQHDRVLLPDIAKQLDMSISTIKRYLHKENTSYQELYDSTRIDIARELLINGNTSIKDISEIIKFSRSSSFCRVFKEKVGYTPGEYRRHYSLE